METTVRVHSNNSVAHDHNARELGLVANTPHIDPDGIHEIWGPDRTVADAYAEIFGDALDAYNARQKRTDRRMTVEQYMESVESDTRGRQPRKRVKGKLVPDEEAKKGKKLSYELVLSVGNTNKLLDEDGIAEYDEETGTQEVHPQEVPYEVNREACRRFVDTFEQRNSHLRIVRCDWHADEFFTNKLGHKEWSTPHAHMEYVPVADGYKTGPELQAALGKALKQQGFSGYEDWQAAEREAFEAIVKEVYAEYCVAHPDYAVEHGDLTIVRPYKGKDAENKSTEEYRKLQDLQQEIAEKTVDLDFVVDVRQSIEYFRKQAEDDKRAAEDILDDAKAEADRIRSEAVEDARRLSESIKDTARVEADKIVKAAQKDAQRAAERVLSDADAEAECIKAAAEADGKQAAWTATKQKREELLDREIAVDLREKTVQEREKALDAREAAVAKREKAVKDWQNDRDRVNRVAAPQTAAQQPERDRYADGSPDV